MFNQTCDRLREYLKNGSSSNLELALTLTPLEVAGKSTTVNPQLLSHASHGTCNNSDNTSLEMPKQMTIFYGGRVFVLQNISSHKANEIMSLASSSTSSMPDTSGLEKLSELPNTFVSDLSQKRTRSLTRFFEKRTDRIKARSPYAITDNSNKPVVTPGHKSWLQLAAGNQ